MIIILKNNFIQTREIKTMVDLISFQLKNTKHNGIIKQIMTRPLGNRLSICPLRFRIASPKISIALGCALVNRISWGGIPESPGAKRSAYYPRDQVSFV